MYSDFSDLAWDRTPLRGWSAREDAVLVDALVATADERARALAPASAAAWLRWSGLPIPDALAYRLEAGLALVVPRAVELLAADPTPVLDLRDLAEPEPLAPVPAPRIDAQAQEEEELSFIDVVVLDARGEPRAGVLYELVLPDATVFTGRTGPDGRLRLDGLRQRGDCQLTFPEAVAA